MPSHTPVSDAALLRTPRFFSAIRHRLEKGRETYGDSSFSRPFPSIIEEIQEELLDVCGWTFTLWDRLEILKEKMK